MEKPRFFWSVYTKSKNVAIFNCTDPDEYNKLEGQEAKDKTVVATIKVGGMVSPLLAETWAQQMTDQLNQFDTANAAVAKMT